MKGLYINIEKEFVVNIEDTRILKGGEGWIPEFEITLGIGTVVSDPREIWGVGYKSENWDPDKFRPTSRFIPNVDNSDETWTIIDHETKTEYYGGWFNDDDYTNVIVIEWDSEIPSNREELEKLLMEEIITEPKEYNDKDDCTDIDSTYEDHRDECLDINPAGEPC